MKKVLLFLLLTVFTTVAFGALEWVGESAVYISVNGGSNTWMNCSTTWAGVNFDGYSFSNVLSFKLGGECRSWDTSGDIAHIGWRLTDALYNEIDGDYIELPWVEQVGNDDKWQNLNSVELIDVTKLIPSTMYRLEVWFWVRDNDAGSDNDKYDSKEGINYVATFVTDVSLPVTLSSFTAETNNGSTILSWTTESEINNAGFNVYRSENKIDYTKINIELIEGAINSTIKNDYSFTDVNVVPIKKYWYKIEDVALNGKTEMHGPVSVLVEESLEVGEGFKLNQCYPNPFNPTTNINFSIGEKSDVSIMIFDINGNHVKTLANSEFQAGNYNFDWNATDMNNNSVSAGVYFCKMITSQGYSQTTKMVLIK